MTKVQIKVNDNGPLLINGEIELCDGEGNIMPAKNPVSLCRCGQSKNMPYCNGAHKGQFESITRAPKS